MSSLLRTFDKSLSITIINNSDNGSGFVENVLSLDVEIVETESDKCSILYKFGKTDF